MEKNFPRLSLNVYEDRYIIYNEERRLHEDAYCVSKFNRVRACRPIVRVRRYKVPISISWKHMCVTNPSLSLPLCTCHYQVAFQVACPPYHFHHLFLILILISLISFLLLH